MAAAEEEITFRCKRTVASTRAVQAGQFYHPSVLDHTMEHSRVRAVFYYQLPAGTNTGSTISKLRATLSELLCDYPVITGRLQRAPVGGRRRWMVKFNDVGVRMVEASARGTVREWLDRADRDGELMLAHWEDMCQKPYFWSTFYIQLTEFEGGGLAVGLSCTNLLADATGATTLVKAWADMNILGKMLTPPYFHPLPPRRSTLSSSNNNTGSGTHSELISHYKATSPPITLTPSGSSTAAGSSARLATVTFSFPEEMVRSCVAAAKNSTAVGAETEPTPFAALAALFWVCISKVKGVAGSLIGMSVLVDVRRALSLHPAFFGSAMVYSRVDVGAGDHHLTRAASAIGDAVGKMEYDNVMGLVEWLEADREEEQEEARPPVDGLVCANWEGLCPYEAVFEEGGGGGSGEPLRVSYYLEPVVGEGHVLILPAAASEGSGRGGGGRVAMVTIPEDQAALLCEEPLLRSFSPTVLMGPRKVHV